jgi:hypothetical protein
MNQPVDRNNSRQCLEQVLRAATVYKNSCHIYPDSKNEGNRIFSRGVLDHREGVWLDKSEGGFSLLRDFGRVKRQDFGCDKSGNTGNFGSSKRRRQQLDSSIREFWRQQGDSSKRDIGSSKGAVTIGLC